MVGYACAIMTSRPEILFPLFADLSTLTGVGSKTAKSFSGLQVFRPRDLIFTLPQSLIDRSLVATCLWPTNGQNRDGFGFGSGASARRQKVSPLSR
jgi:hypothetical protein